MAEKLLAVAHRRRDAGEPAVLRPAVRWAAGQGISQFLDLGCGMPTAPSTHGSAQLITADPQVAYVDNDAVVLARRWRRTATPW